MVIRKGRGLASIIGIVIVLLLTPPFAFAWNSVGHGVVAAIAYAQLSAAQKRQLETWIKPIGYYYPAVHNVNTLAAWPDWLKKEGVRAFNTWHYISKPYGLNHYPLHQVLISRGSFHDPNVVWAINYSEAVLARGKTNPLMQSKFLGFLMHCVGDIHQPFHAINGYSIAHPQGDRGGNDIKVRAMDHQWHSLHSVWDSGFGLFSGQLGQTPSQRVNDLAKSLMAHFPPAYFGKKIEVLDPEVWANESYALAASFGYNTGAILSHPYVTMGRKITMERITLAGYRLAGVLKKEISQAHLGASREHGFTKGRG